jgi:hypothetical protein
MATAPRRRRRQVIETDVTALAIDSNFEAVTRAAFNYRQQNVYPYVEGKGFAVVRCQGPLARRHYVAPEAGRPNVAYMTGVGHGSYDTYTGDYYDPIFRVGHYTQEEANGKIVHFLSCQTARTLGPDFVRQGCRAFFGYDENFTFVMADAAAFFECDSAIDRAFADGMTAAQVYDHVGTLYNQRIADLRAAGKLYSAATLEFDRDHLRAPASGSQWGDPKAKLD